MNMDALKEIEIESIYLVGTEWFIYEEHKEGAPTRHPCYQKVFSYQPKWDFNHVYGCLKDLVPDGAKVYLFGGSEGHCLPDPATNDTGMEPVLVPILCALVTTQEPPSRFGIQQKDEDEMLVPIAELGCSWQPLKGSTDIFYLACKHVGDMAAVEAASVEEQAKYGYASLHIEPEKVQPDADPDKEEAKNVLCVAYSTGQSGAMQIEFDLRTDTLVKVAQAAVREEELPAEHVGRIVEALRGPVEAATLKKEEEKQRRAAMDPAVKAEWRNARRVKFYPQNEHLRLDSKFINRYFEKATDLFPAPAPSGFAAAFQPALNPFFNAGPPVEITDEATAPPPAPRAPKTPPAPEKDEMEVDEPKAKAATPKLTEAEKAERKKEAKAKAHARKVELDAKKAAAAVKRKEANAKGQETRKKKREAAELEGNKEPEEEQPTRQLRKRQKKD